MGWTWGLGGAQRMPTSDVTMGARGAQCSGGKHEIKQRVSS